MVPKFRCIFKMGTGTGGRVMEVLDKVSGVIVEVAWTTNNGFVYHLINSEGVIYRRFSDEIEQVEE